MKIDNIGVKRLQEKIQAIPDQNETEFLNVHIYLLSYNCMLLHFRALPMAPNLLVCKWDTNIHNRFIHVTLMFIYHFGNGCFPINWLHVCIHIFCRILKAVKSFWIPYEVPVSNLRNIFSDKNSRVLIISRIKGINQSESCMTINLRYTDIGCTGQRMSQNAYEIDDSLAPAYFNMFQWKCTSGGWFLLKNLLLILR